MCTYTYMYVYEPNRIAWNLCPKLRHFMPQKAAIKISTQPLGFGKWCTTTPTLTPTHTHIPTTTFRTQKLCDICMYKDHTIWYISTLCAQANYEITAGKKASAKSGSTRPRNWAPFSFFGACYLQKITSHMRTKNKIYKKPKEKNKWRQYKMNRISVSLQ